MLLRTSPKKLCRQTCLLTGRVWCVASVLGVCVDESCPGSLTARWIGTRKNSDLCFERNEFASIATHFCTNEKHSRKLQKYSDLAIIIDNFKELNSQRFVHS